MLYIYNIYIFGSVCGVSHRDTDIGDSNEIYHIILSSPIILAACQGGVLVLNLTWFTCYIHIDSLHS